MHASLYASLFMHFLGICSAVIFSIFLELVLCIIRLGNIKEKRSKSGLRERLLKLKGNVRRKKRLI